MANIALQCKDIHVYFDGTLVFGNIEAVNVPDVERCEKKLDVQLKVRGECPEIGPVGKMKKECEIRGALENDYGEIVQASWKFRLGLMHVPKRFFDTTVFEFNANIYEHVVNGEEKYYIDILNDIRRIDGKDRLTAIREAIGI